MRILKERRIDRADADAVLLGKVGDVARVLIFFEIPQHVDGRLRAAAGEPMHESDIVQFVFDGRGGGVLWELAEARAGVGKAPAWQLDLQGIQRSQGGVFVERGAGGSRGVGSHGRFLFSHFDDRVALDYARAGGKVKGGRRRAEGGWRR